MLGSDLAASCGNHAECVGMGLHEHDHLKIPYFQCDLTDFARTRRLIRDQQPDVILHVAAMTNVDGCEADPAAARLGNVVATENVATAAASISAAVIFFSTDYVFDGTEEGEYEETDRTNPVSTYGVSKLNAEMALRAANDKFMIVRTSWLFGLHGRSFPRTILERARTQKEFQVVCDQIGRPTYTRDLAFAVSDFIKTRGGNLAPFCGEIYHIAGEEIASWCDFATYLLKTACFEGVSVTGVATEDFPRPARRPRNSVLSTAKAADKLGITLRGYKEALPEFIAELASDKGLEIS